MASVELAFALAGAILLLGFLGYYLSRKFRIPDILILIWVGYLITSSFKLIDPAPLKPIVPLFTSLALLVILFDGGLQLELHKFLKESPRAFVLSVLAFVLSMLGVAAFMHFLLGWDLLLSLLLGSIIGDSSATVAIAMTRNLNIPERVKTLISLESTYNSPITIVVTLVILQLIVVGGEAQIYSSAAQGIASAFSIGIVLGLIAGVFWLRVLYELRGGSYEDILTLAFALLGFSTVQILGGNGAIFALIFGLVLGNGNIIGRMFRMEKRASAGVLMKRFQAQISFLVRTFFFIYIGVVFVLPAPLILLYSLILAAILVIARYAATILSLLGDNILIEYKNIVTAIMPRGLSTAVLTPLVLGANIKNGDILAQIVITMIILTAIIATVGSYYFHRQEAA